ncbi:haloacid dehalogenase type II [Aquimarina sp. W85]|uniref:haloacid dehalogenase type II n=1 Tax=Aquimarina rhodophyticola TaxID=3342246 RepID=UPI00366AD82E
MKKLPKVLIFDVNETLLDLTPIKIKINDALQCDTAFDLWFSALLHRSLVETTTGGYMDFGILGSDTLKIVSKKLQNPFTDGQIDDILSIFTKLSPHPEIIASLKSLQKEGFTLVALTNGGQKTVEAQLDFAKLSMFFDRIISVAKVNKFKPHPSTYKYVLDTYGIQPKEAMLIAAHNWDVYGAQMAGLQTAFITRDKKEYYDMTSQLDYVGTDLRAITQQLTGNNKI